MVDFLDYKIKKEFQIIKDNYKKMYHPDNKEFNDFWETYVELYFDLKSIGLDIPVETEYSLYFDYYFKDTGYRNLNQYYRDSYNEFCRMMEEMIETVEGFLGERETL